MDAEFATGDAVPVIPGRQAHLFEEFVVVGERRQHLEFERDGIVLFQALVKDPLRGAAGRLVHDHGVHGVIQVLHEHLPVGIMQVTETTPGYFNAAFRGAFHQVVDGDRRAAQPGLQIRPIGRQAGEHQAVVAVNPRDLLHVGFRLALAETGAAVALLPGDMEQRPVGIEYVTMIAAAQFGHVAATVSDHLCALVAAAVEQHIYLAVLMPGHHHRLPADAGGEIIPRFFYLAVMADIDPGPVPDTLHLQVEDFGIGIDFLMDAILPDQSRQLVVSVMRHLQFSRRCCIQPRIFR